eukprot:11225734-Alexandrium_andersonii.AAC.1
MDTRVRVLRGPGLHPGRETLYISDVDLGPEYSTLIAEGRDQRIVQVAMHHSSVLCRARGSPQGMRGGGADRASREAPCRRGRG